MDFVVTRRLMHQAPSKADVFSSLQAGKEIWLLVPSAQYLCRFLSKPAAQVSLIMLCKEEE